MQANEFARKCRTSMPVNPSERVLVMVKDRDTGIMSTVKEVKLERHDDGSETLWVEVEEY